MDERVEKEEINHTSEMAGWGDDEQLIKEKSMLSWIKNRSKEISTWSGAGLVGRGLSIVLGGPFVNLLAWAAIAWGLYSMWKSQ